MTTLYIIGGTTEANLAGRRLEDAGYRVVISVTTPVGAQMAKGMETDIGAKDAEAIAAHAREVNAAAIIDCSHPFAVKVSWEAQCAAEAACLPYLRYQRPPISAPNAVTVDSWAEAVERLQRRGDRALLTIGSRNLSYFAEAGLDFMARVLPVPDSINECARLGIDVRDVIAVCPPFSVDFNRACIRFAGAGVLVTKDSGKEGGLQEKLEAVETEGIDIIVVSRPEEPHAAEVIGDLDRLVNRLEEILDAH